LPKPAPSPDAGPKVTGPDASPTLFAPEPKTAAGFYRRGIFYSQIRVYDLAIADFDELIRINPGIASAYTGRGYAWLQKQQYEKAIADYSEALRLDPRDSNALNGCAWVWSTCPDLQYRDGKKAVETATKACELSLPRDAYLVDTLAAAYAETGDFEAAVKKQNEAIGLLTDEKKLADFYTRLELYQQKKPYRQGTQ
jgi:tetratricopeptide (TPR) repeat protein